MVVEGIILPYLKEKKNLGIIVSGIVITLIAGILAFLAFYEQASLSFVFLIVLGCVPFIYKTIIQEEKHDLIEKKELPLLKSHARIIGIYLLLFLGITLATTILYLLLPFALGNESNVVFAVQETTITTIRASAAYLQTGYIAATDAFYNILANNLKVLLLCLIFSFLYGLGAVFIITWNATVLGVAIGQTISAGLAKISTQLGFYAIAQYFNVISYSILRYAVHGIFEIAGYFVIGLAGGIISVAVIRHDFKPKYYPRILIDVVDLIAIAVGLIVLGAIIESFVTPILF
ncbi:MAG: stage II sporulation protein M [Candidatus Woesearchaeota archaeon]